MNIPDMIAPNLKKSGMKLIGFIIVLKVIFSNAILYSLEYYNLRAIKKDLSNKITLGAKKHEI